MADAAMPANPSLGRHEIKGIADPVAAWAIEGVSDAESRFEAVRCVPKTSSA